MSFPKIVHKQTPGSSSQSQQGMIVSLPQEVLMLILNQIHDAATLNATSLTSKQFYNLIYERRRLILKNVWQIDVSSPQELTQSISKAIHSALYQLQTVDTEEEIEKAIYLAKTWALSFGGGVNIWIKKNKTLFSSLCEIIAQPKLQINNSYLPYINLLKWGIESEAKFNLDGLAIPPLFAFIMQQPRSPEEQQYFEEAVTMCLKFGASGAREHTRTYASKSKISALDYAKNCHRSRLYDLLWNSLSKDEQQAYLAKATTVKEKLRGLFKHLQNRK